MTIPAETAFVKAETVAFDRAVNDLVDAAYAAVATGEMYRDALVAIRDYDSFQGGSIAPRPTPTEDALKRIAREALG